ncbi:hypothetical protein KY361_02440 [Candidatus Woesearchaeota archaeon]|nr:hypothetical protein [Candidatus Woesearchaeota archaeon]
MAWWTKEKKEEKKGPEKEKYSEAVQRKRLGGLNEDLRLTEAELTRYADLKRKVSDFRKELAFVGSYSPMYQSVNRSKERLARLEEQAKSLFREVKGLERLQEKLRALKNEELVDYIVGLKGIVLPRLKARFRRDLRVEHWIEEGTFTLEKLLRRAITAFKLRTETRRPNVQPLMHFFAGVESLIDRGLKELAIRVADINDLRASIGKAA